MNNLIVFIDRPIFASVISSLILTAWSRPIPLLPISQYPENRAADRVSAHLSGCLARKRLAETSSRPL